MTFAERLMLWICWAFVCTAIGFIAAQVVRAYLAPPPIAEEAPRD